MRRSKSREEVSIFLSAHVIEGLETAGLGDFHAWEEPERMAWIVVILKKLPDNPRWFPRGQWATIQSIEGQLDNAAREAINTLRPHAAQLLNSLGED